MKVDYLITVIAGVLNIVCIITSIMKNDITNALLWVILLWLMLINLKIDKGDK